MGLYNFSHLMFPLLEERARVRFLKGFFI